MLLAEFFDNVYYPRRLRGKSVNSVRLYRLCIVQFDRTLGRKAKLDDLTEETVLRHLARRSGIAPATRNKELSQLLALWRLAAQQGRLRTWPDIHREHEPERSPVAWMPDELQRLLSAAAAMPGKIAEVPAGIWWTAMILLMLDTGERIGAIRHAQWTWCQGEWMLIPAEARKGKTRDRRYRLSARTQEAIAKLRAAKAPGKFMLPWPYADTYLWNRYRLVVAAAGLPTGRKYQSHCLRKTTASCVYAAGMDPQDALDHSDRRTTKRYLDPRFTHDRQPCDILADYLANPRRPPQQSRGVG